VICSHAPPERSPEAAHAVLLCEELAQAGEDVTLITSTSSSQLGRGYRVRSEVRTWRWMGLIALARSIRNTRPDATLILYLPWIYGYHPMITFVPAMIRLLAPASGIAIQFENVQWIESRWTKTLRPLLYPFKRWGANSQFGLVVPLSDALIFLCPEHRDDVLRVVPQAQVKSEVLPAPPLGRPPILTDLRPDSVRAAHGFSRAQFVICYVGYVYRGKGLEYLIDALKGLRLVGLDAVLAVLGGVTEEAYGAELIQLVSDHGLEEYVRWMGDFDPQLEGSTALLAASDACVLPFDLGARLNNSSVALAAYHGVPLVITGTEDSDRAFINRINALVCPPCNSEALTNAILDLSANEGLRAQLARGAQELGRDVFSWSRTVAETVRILSSSAGASDARQVGRRRASRLRPS
jgi:glycosyltransferase involved in cell wall biosynthesis